MTRARPGPTPPSTRCWLPPPTRTRRPPSDLALQRAADLEIFDAARDAGALVMTKDADFAALVNQFGAPPQIVLLTCGNTSNAHLRQVLGTAWPTVLLMLERGEPLVEVGDRPR